MRFALLEIPGGIAGADRTVEEITRHVKHDLRRPTIRLVATRLMHNENCPSKDQVAEARAIYRFVSREIRYQRDPIDIETVQSPEVTLRVKAGDCDDMVALVAALAQSIGLPVRFRILGYTERELVHILPEIYASGRWYPADTTEPGKGFGWRPPRFPIERIYTLKGDNTNMQTEKVVSSGLGFNPAAAYAAFETGKTVWKKLFGGPENKWGMKNSEIEQAITGQSDYRMRGLAARSTFFEDNPEILQGLSKADLFYRLYGMRFAAIEPGFSNPEDWFQFDPDDLSLEWFQAHPHGTFSAAEMQRRVVTKWQNYNPAQYRNFRRVKPTIPGVEQAAVFAQPIGIGLLLAIAVGAFVLLRR